MPIGRPPTCINIVNTIRELRRSGLSYREIAHEINVSHTTCWRYCKEKT